MKAWEYLVIGKRGKVLGERGLNDLGIEGWELVTVLLSYDTMRAVVRIPTRFYIFKRPKKT